MKNWPENWPYPPRSEPATAGSAMVVTTDRYASEVGVRVLTRGGNAIDAAVATAFALAVVNPEAGNLGGGGFLLFRSAEGGVWALDHRTTAPAAATPDMLLDTDGSLSGRAVIGHLSVGVPGTVQGLWEAHRRFGSLAWEELLEPAVQLAGGFVVGSRFLDSLSPGVVDGLRRFPHSAAVFLTGGGPPPLGVRAPPARPGAHPPTDPGGGP